MALWCYCLFCLLIRSLSGTCSNSPGETRRPWVAASLAPGEVMEISDGVCKFPKQRLSWWQAQESCEQRFGHLPMGPPDGVLASRLRNPVWLGQRETSLRRPPRRSERTTLALVFGEKTADRAARLRTPLPSSAPWFQVRCAGTFEAGTLPSEECPTWNPEPPTEGSEFCLQPLLFLCCYQKETYQQLQDVRLWPGQDVISKVNALANAIVLLPDPLSEAPEALTLDKASRFLGLLDRVLVEETTPLGPAALLATLHFLKRVTALGAGEPEPLTGPWELLGRGVVSVASRILEKQVAGAWLSLSEVVGGPMALVASMQRLAPLLSTVLTSEQPRMSIQHHHAGLEVRSLHLREASAGGYIFTMPGGHPEGPGHIHIPAGEVRRLLGKGLSGVTMIHSWFTSSVFQYALGVPALEPQASDSSEEADRMQRFLSTQVGSAILSSEVWDAVGEVSTAVTFHLQHQAQSPSVPSPPPSPHTGGSWATAGCSVLSLYQDSTACFCNHSTSFAVLLQVYDIQRGPEEESLLRTLSFVGCGVSLCALATTFLLFLAAGVPKSERTTVHKNLTFSLASAEGFLMASEWAKDNKVACVAVTAAMHFLFLVAFSWMLVEGLLLWNKVVAVSMRPGPKMRLYYVIGWGMPVVIVAITMATSPHDYVAAGHCWLDVHTDTIWAFAGPVLLVLLANTYILFRVVMVTVSSARRRARMLSPQPGLRQQIKIQMWATVKPVLVLLPILGLTWLVGILVHLSPVWAYIAVGLNSFQGPYIFLVYAAYNGEVRSALQRKKAAALAVGQAGPTTVTISCGTCSGPSSQQPPGPWEAPRTPPRRHVALRGIHGPRIPTAFSSIAEPERPAVELTAFKASASPAAKRAGSAPCRRVEWEQGWRRALRGAGPRPHGPRPPSAPAGSAHLREQEPLRASALK
ncbi:adhesion G-protein coupled receptor D2 [Marmota marmota marmota]|uniref:adhesion G-protein coupled receptor D2 n=1 Tax=Marmota marmota marmota TaxID=9994 RepID=UPI0020921394|nr:adhesion G-protein coupled receptor D2 [Marmota marmota marmota]